MAATLALGRDAVLSHTSAGALWGMLTPRRRVQPASRALAIHVTVRGHGETRRGIRVHRSRTLSDHEITRRLGIPVTTPSRTLMDLRRILPKPRFDQAVRQAEYLGLPIEAPLDPDHTRSELERRFLGLCRRHRLGKPEINAEVGAFIVDFLWPERRLIAEVDGYRAHGSRSAFERDRARDVELKVLGYEVLRFTWTQVVDRPTEVAGALGKLLR